MSQRFIKIYQKFDVKEIEQHVLVYGDLTANCSRCQAVSIGLDASHCPECKTEFKYIAFRNIKHHLTKLANILKKRPYVLFIDYEDFKKNLSAIKAEEFLK